MNNAGDDYFRSLMVPVEKSEPVPRVLKKSIIKVPQKRGRKKVYASPAERQAAYRARKAQKGSGHDNL